VAKKILRKQGYTVHTVENGVEALEALEQSNFEVVLMDMQMPVMDGREAIVAIRRGESASGHHQPIIAVTANALKGDREDCLSVGADDYVSKPFQIRTLISAIQALQEQPQPEPAQKH